MPPVAAKIVAGLPVTASQVTYTLIVPYETDGLFAYWRTKTYARKSGGKIVETVPIWGSVF